MITILEQGINNQRQNFIKTDLSKKLVEENQITEYTKRLWFKGSRFR